MSRKRHSELVEESHRSFGSFHSLRMTMANCFVQAGYPSIGMRVDVVIDPYDENAGLAN